MKRTRGAVSKEGKPEGELGPSAEDQAAEHERQVELEAARQLEAVDRAATDGAGVAGPCGAVRLHVARIVDNKWFDRFILLVIIVNCAWFSKCHSTRGTCAPGALPLAMTRAVNTVVS